MKLLRRIPRETKVAAIVLGMALLQVGVLATLGLRSTSERREGIERELRADTRRTVVQGVQRQARERVVQLGAHVERELERGGAPLGQRIGAALTPPAGMAREPVYADAFLVDADLRIWHWKRPPLVARATGGPDPEAERRLAALQAREAAEPAEVLQAAQELADWVEARPASEWSRGAPDLVAAALALQAGWRAAYRLGQPDVAWQLAERVRLSYGALRDDRALAESEPFGAGASALQCHVTFEALPTSPVEFGRRFVDVVLRRRQQAQSLGPLISAAGYAFERDACSDLHDAARRYLLDVENMALVDGLARCDHIDAELALLRHPEHGLRPAALAKLVDTHERAGFFVGQGESGRVVAAFPVRAEPGDAHAAAEVVLLTASPLALYRCAVAPFLEAVGASLPDGMGVVVRDGTDRALHGDAEAPEFTEPVPLEDVVPGLRSSVVLLDRSVLEGRTDADRLKWLLVLIGTGLGVLAAALLALRSVLREVHLARMKGDFVSNLSHELRTPLTSLRMFVETLQEGRVRDEAERQECLGVIAQETERLSRLVDRTLQFASFSRGRAPLDVREVDLTRVVGQAVQIFAKRAEAASAKVELRAPKEPPEVWLDRDAIVQVVLNLLDNAVKYGREDGATISVTVRVDAGRGVIEVEDDGPGVPERERDLVFEEFYRGDESLSGRVQGTGIGLALCKRIVRAHGGRIEVGRSQRLGGARFRVTMPNAAAGRRLAGTGGD